ncbi:putative LRR receptor-like protein kinase [Cocos nucifera]|uniref:Putative LRR receptor-like protein kinase n=1 Tax=Cocos nucifera TaxID=13894 RepID=A0A8K0I8E8_COCNU|nr:putative LRR receptor-like protein kinase [Cocos nucifera]
MGTLRSFRNQNKNCYLLPSPSKVKYLIRAGFYYGNYDGVGKPPTFDLMIDANKWVTVVTSMENPILEEAIYAAKGDTISICLARTQADQIPFISSVEAMPLTETMYGKMNRNYAWFLNYRVHFGGTDVIGYPDDEYNRMWNPFPTPSLRTIIANFTELTGNCADDPPVAAILHAVEATNNTSSISLSFNFTGTSRSNYLALYFTEVGQLGADRRRAFNITIDGRDYGLTVAPRYQICDEVNATTDPAVGVMNISISPLEDSNLPPVISAAEVYTASPTLVEGSHQADLDGLETLKNAFNQLQAWTGDPCLPNNTVWEWLGCNADDPPRVTSLYMDGNHLGGEIPDFLGSLPNLRQLNLAYNNLEGFVPRSLTSNKNIRYNVTGNPSLEQQPKAEGKGKKVLNALWSLVLLGLIGYGVWWCCCRPRRDVVLVAPPPQQQSTMIHMETRATVVTG